jgi:hypothetical protein
MPCNVFARRLRRRSIKIAAIAAMAGTPTPMPTPRPIFSPVLEGDASPVLEREMVGTEVLDPEDIDVGVVDVVDTVDEAEVEEEDEVLLVVLMILEVDTPIVAARTTRFFIAQHCSEVRLLPQHQVPSVEHCDIPIF